MGQSRADGTLLHGSAYSSRTMMAVSTLRHGSALSSSAMMAVCTLLHGSALSSSIMLLVQLHSSIKPPIFQKAPIREYAKFCKVRKARVPACSWNWRLCLHKTCQLLALLSARYQPSTAWSCNEGCLDNS